MKASCFAAYVLLTMWIVPFASGEDTIESLSDIRTWTDTKGDTIQARFSGYENGVVLLATPDDSQVSVGIIELLPKDQEIAATLAYTETVERSHQKNVKALQAKREAVIGEMKEMAARCDQDIKYYKKVDRRPQIEYKKNGGRMSYAAIRNRAKAHIYHLTECKKAIEGQLDALPVFTDPPRTPPYLHVKRLKAGAFGHPDRKFEVLQIFGSDEMHGWFVGSDGFNYTERIIVTGYPTEGLAEHAKIKFERPLEYVGTRTYMTVWGSQSTVQALRVMPIDKKHIPKGYGGMGPNGMWGSGVPSISNQLRMSFNSWTKKG